MKVVIKFSRKAILNIYNPFGGLSAFCTLKSYWLLNNPCNAHYIIIYLAVYLSCTYLIRDSIRFIQIYTISSNIPTVAFSRNEIGKVKRREASGEGSDLFSEKCIIQSRREIHPHSFSLSMPKRTSRLTKRKN